MAAENEDVGTTSAPVETPAPPEVAEAPAIEGKAPQTAQDRRDARIKAALEVDGPQEEDSEEGSEDEGDESDEKTPAEPKKEEPEEGEELFSERVAHINSKMRELAHAQQELKAERHRFTEEMRATKAERDDMVDTMTRAAELAKENPPELFRRLGVDLWKWVEQHIGDGASDPQTHQSTTPNFDPNQFEQRISGLLEQKLSEFASTQKQEQNRMRFEAQVRKIASDSEQYPEMASDPDRATEMMRDALVNHYKKYGERLDPVDVAPHIEQYLFNQNARLLEKIAKDERYAKLLGSNGEPKKQTPAPSPQKRSPTPMTNEMTTESSAPPRPRTKEDRLAAAAALAIEADLKF